MVIEFTPQDDPDYPWRLETPYYVAEMSGYLDASVADLSKYLLRHSIKGSGQVTGYLSDMLAFVDHTGTPDIIRALPHAPAVVEGNRIAYDTGYGIIGYEASLTEFKLTTTLYAPILDASGNPRVPAATLDPRTAMLTVTGGMVISEGVSLIDCTGGEGEIATPGEVYLVDPDGARVLTLDRIRAWDSAEPRRNDSHGEIRVVSDGAGGRRVYQGVSWAWLKTVTLPAFIDPTLVVASSTINSGGHREADLADGTRYACVYATGNKVYVLKPGGAWTLVSGIAPVGASGADVDLAVDNDGIIWGVSEAGSGAALTLFRWVPSADRLTLTQTTTAYVAASAGVQHRTPRIAVTGAAGATKNITVAYESFQTGPVYDYFCKAATATTGGTVTLGAATSFVSGGTTVRYYDLSADASGNVYFAYVLGTGTSVQVKRADNTGTATAVTIPSTSAGIALGINGMSDCYWVFRSTLISRTAVIGTVPITDVTATAAGNVAAAGIPSAGVVVLIGKRTNAPNATYSGLWTINVSTGAITDRGTVQTTTADDTTPYHHCAKGPFTGQIPFLFAAAAAAGVNSEVAIVNQAPSAPLLSVPSTAFSAADGTQLTITHQDPDADTGGSYHLKRVRSDAVTDYWSVAAANFVGTETDNDGFGPTYTILAASNATEWVTTGLTYQLTAQTRDTSGVWGPYSPTPVVVTPGTKPVAGLTAPSTTVTSSPVTAQGTSTQAVSAYRYELLDAAGTTVLEDPGWKSGSTIPPYTFTYTPANVTSYKVRFTARNTTGTGIDSAPALLSFSTSFNPPLAPTGLTATANVAGASIGLAWIQTNNATVASSWCVERSSDGGATWTKQAVVSVTNYTDYTPASGKPYSYRVQAIGSNGVMTASTPATASVSWSDWVFRPVDGSPLVTFSLGINQPAKVSWHQNQEINVPQTQSTLRRRYIGPYQARTADIAAAFGNSNGTAYSQREALRGYILAGAEGWLKSPSGDVWKGVLEDIGGSIATAPKWEEFACKFRETRKGAA
jgi:hypothetical protein